MLGDYLPHRIALSSGHAWVKTVRAEDGAWVRVLASDGVYQSATYLDERWAELVFKYYRGFDVVFEIAPKAARVLMIGGGGYAWPKHVAATRSDVALDVVELEPAITEAAKRWFFLDRAMAQHPGAINVISGDGRVFLDNRGKETSNERYDVIVLDAFAGGEPVLSLATVEATKAAKESLVAGGVLAANVVSADEGLNVSFLRDLVATWSEVFTSVQVIPCEEDSFAIEDNYLVLASDSSISLKGAIPYDADFLGSVLYD